MAISNMQQPQQIQSGIGSLQDPRQRYFLGKLVKKAGRAVKKIVKSPIGKMALLGGLGYGLGGGFTGGFGSNKFGAFLKGGFGNFMKGNKGTIGGGLSNLFRTKDKLGNYGGFDTGKLLLGGLGATALAAPFLMGGDEEEEDIDVMDPRYQVQRAKNYYSGAGDAGAGLDFMPQKRFVMENFYAADGGRAGYANGMLVEDEEEEYIRSGAGMSRRMPKAFLSMGGGAGQAQAEQMLMMEYVKYKNKGGTLSFEQFVKAVMQQQAPEGAGMEQPEAVQMAANGGRIGYKWGGLGNLMSKIKTGAQQAGGKIKSLFDDADINVSIRDEDVMTDWGPQAQAVGQDVFITPKSNKAVQVMDELINEGYDIAKAEDGTYAINSIDEGALDIITQRLRIGSKGADEFIASQDYVGGPEDFESKMIYDALRNKKAEGGIMETEEASELIDLGGQEKDYRETGGFVDLGGKERADDVPARLSKNEFVFTADAVRNAGGGDIDKGAEVMENLMNNLEQGGEVSEDSQGLEGAQAMYDQQQMLQSRMI